MAENPSSGEHDSKTKILQLLDENRVMTVATLRPDGWPQATVVGYVHDDLMLYFAVARISQKFANIARDPRISIALGHDAGQRLRGLSMAAHAAEVTNLAEIEHLNALMRDRYPEQGMFSPREISVVILRAAPTVISIIDLAKGPGEPDLVEVNSEVTVRPIIHTPADAPGRPDGTAKVLVQHLLSNPDRYRADAPP
ncbi:MAG TPA: pyridoxamine 5'-phosphate oxidase family protein [Caulobacteraceae bacterium]